MPKEMYEMALIIAFGNIIGIILSSMLILLLTALLNSLEMLESDLNFTVFILFSITGAFYLMGLISSFLLLRN